MSDSASKMPTTERLAMALAERNNPRLAPMIQRAREGYYDDYKSELPFPLTQLVRDLRQNGEHELADRAVSGEFDGTKEEADVWAQSEEGQQVFRAFGRGG